MNETAGLLADVHAGILASALPVQNTTGATTSSAAGGGVDDVCHPYVAGEGTCSDMGAAGANVSHTTGPYNGRASEPWRSYSGMFYAGALDKKTAAEIIAYNQNHSKLSHCEQPSLAQPSPALLVLVLCCCGCETAS